MRAMILSAGYGTRLWPLTEDRTKPAIPILGKPLVGYVAEYLAGYGCDEIVVNLHHRPESVRRALGDGGTFGVRLHYVEEPEILGTSGGIQNARALLDDGTFIVVNGKIITDIDLNAALETHRRARAIATLVVLPNPSCARFSIVKASNGMLLGFGGMPSKDDFVGNDPPLMFTGIQILEPAIFDYIPRGVFSHSTTDVYPQAVAAGEQVAVHVAEGNWYELSTIERYLDISLQLMSRTGVDVTMGAGCNISKSAAVKEAILWDNVIVEDGARVSRAILADNVRVPAGAVITNAAVVHASLVAGKDPPAKALKGEFRDDNFVVSLAE
ncbi:MAG: mannose-phosphate guanylyltransferase / phosphomannomutase [Pyrinomonadaceae bacterium]|nr:mannose-phosphate guanylyltransferase / phosphomannomutase [Pyrinomonadaceae bacterium]